MGRSQTLQEHADALAELDVLLEQWFKNHYDDLPAEVQDKLIVGMIGYLCSQSVIHQGREV